MDDQKLCPLVMIAYAINPNEINTTFCAKEKCELWSLWKKTCGLKDKH